MGWTWVRRPTTRRLIFGVVILLLAVFTLFPPRYVGNVKLAPQDTNTAGLSSILSQLGGNYAALLGNHQPVEIDLTLGRSFYVKAAVARQLGMVDAGADRAKLEKAIAKLDKRVTVRALRGGVIEIEVTGRDQQAVLRTAAVYSKAMQDRLAALSRNQTNYKRQVLNERMADAATRLTRAENAVSTYRQQNQLVAPETQLGNAVATLSALQAQYQAVQVELQKALRFNREDSYQVKSIRASLAAMQAQIRFADQRARAAGGLTAAGLAPKALEFARLTRELTFAQSLYDSYTRYLEGAAIEELTADFNMQVIEPPFIAPGWQFNTIPLVLLVFALLLLATVEFYILRPPPGARLAVA